MMSNLMAILLQSLALKLGIAAERDLAQMCREHYSRPVSRFLWMTAEIAIAACDLAEVIGTAIALQTAFRRPRSVIVPRTWSISVGEVQKEVTSVCALFHTCPEFRTIPPATKSSLELFAIVSASMELSRMVQKMC